MASGSDIPDAPSGFRAISRTAAQRLMVFNDYTYTLEMIIQAGQKNMAIASVPVRVNGDFRPSRLVKSIPSAGFGWHSRDQARRAGAWQPRCQDAKRDWDYVAVSGVV